MSDCDKEACPKCGGLSIIGSFDVTAVFEKRGSRIVRKRGVEFIDMRFLCESCGHKWSARTCVIGVRFCGFNKSELAKMPVFKEGFL